MPASSFCSFVQISFVTFPHAWFDDFVCFSPSSSWWLFFGNLPYVCLGFQLLAVHNVLML